MKYFSRLLIFAMFLTLNIAYSKVKTDLYGKLKFSAVSSSQKVVSFSANNHAAVTHAAQVDTTTSAQKAFDEERRTSYNAQQSRFGMWINKNEDLGGRVEVDFLDASQSSHGVGEQLRVRLAYITANLSDHWSLQAGQKWLIYSGLNPHTHNIVQASFFSGNSGFVAIEAAAKHTGDSLDFYIGLGNKGKNTTTDQNQKELGSIPAVSMRLDYKVNKSLVGAALTYGKLINKKLSTNTNSTFKDSNSYGAKLFSKIIFDSSELIIEGFYGENTEDLNLLALSGANFDTSSDRSIHTHGGFFSYKMALSDSKSLYAGYGMAAHNQAEKKLSSGSLSSNSLARLGFESKTKIGLIAYAELTALWTEYVEANQQLKEYDANVLELGLSYNF